MAKKQDKLAREAAQALACNMSYGKWKAMQPVVKVEKKQIPEGWKECPVCGKVFKPSKYSQKYCEPYCRNQAYAPRENEIKRAYMKKFRERKKEYG